MPGHVRALLTVLCIAIASVPLEALADTSTRPAAKLFEVSGMQTQIARVATAIGKGFDSAAVEDFTGRELSSEALAQIRAALVDAFNPDRLTGIVLSTLDAEMSDGDIDRAIAWHHSELGRRITHIETVRSPLSGSADRQRYLRSLQTRPPADSRLALVRKLDQAWKATDSSVSMMIDMQVAVSVAMMNALPVDQRTSVSALVDIYEAQRGALSAHYAGETLLSMLYTYADLSDDELEAYAGFARTLPGQGYVEAINLALHKAMLEGSYALGRQLGAVLHKHDSSTNL